MMLLMVYWKFRVAILSLHFIALKSHPQDSNFEDRRRDSRNHIDAGERGGGGAGRGGDRDMRDGRDMRDMRDMRDEIGKRKSLQRSKS